VAYSVQRAEHSAPPKLLLFGALEFVLGSFFNCPDIFLGCLLQGVDLIAGGRNKKVRREAAVSENVYLQLLVKVRIVSDIFI